MAFTQSSRTRGIGLLAGALTESVDLGDIQGELFAVENAADEETGTIAEFALPSATEIELGDFGATVDASSIAFCHQEEAEPVTE